MGPIHRAMRFVDIAGHRFGSLTAQWPEGRRQGAVIWLCMCDCGKLSHVATGQLRRTRLEPTRRCRECAALLVTSHGMSYSSEYHRYVEAKSRCTNPKHKAWKNYGGRGIRFLFNSFEEFFKEIGPCPDGLELDRINNEGHYEPGNVRWATVREQALNRRSKHRGN